MRTILLLAAFGLAGAPSALAQSGCGSSDQYRQFDFWVGNWEVTTGDGNVAGTNRIEKITGDCVVFENWTSSQGGTGKSFSYYDPSTKLWRQLWVDGTGGHMKFEGSVVDGAMDFKGTWIKADGTTSMMWMIYTPLDDGRVRQFVRESTDDGATWTPWFDGYYRPVDSLD